MTANLGFTPDASGRRVVVDPSKPLEVLRVIHSFDPCLACATHLYGEDGGSLAEIVVR